ncbi:hypothetical protein AKJ38_03165 [candidate division MSBL1 archaeon SCGC-AAA259I14]|uniref:Mut7-C RNAse domain-containing protein n=1 Tax=candidate division MSBL1 archaeon SCGC-AAA259I14 TaxID=1698268 RepID=A0A133UQJ4_9EURY|nr:hypothetical protein AKJ38_03165 [candidate division MSBL1 archaeon SCGC-AAA259I14]
MKIIADGMLGKITRWLRLAGEDVININDYPISPEEEDEVLLNIAEEQSRILITRDVNLYRRAVKKDIESILLEETDDIAKQLLKISESVDGDVEIDLNNSRCPVCNGKLKAKGKSFVSGKVPKNVLEKNDKFWRCEDCGKIYWQGSHWKKMAETLEKYEDLRG